MARVSVAIACFFGTFAIAGIFNDQSNAMERRSLITKVLNGLSHMELTDYAITFGIALVTVFLVLLVLSGAYSERKIIVGLSFHPSEKKVKIRTRKLGDDNFHERTVTYSEIRLAEERLSDGITSLMYNCITFKGVGHYFKDHDMWSNQFEIESEISKLIR